MLKRFLAYYKPHKKIFFWDMTASLTVSLIAILYPILTREMLNVLIPEGKGRMTAGDFVRGRKIALGDILE